MKTLWNEGANVCSPGLADGTWTLSGGQTRCTGMNEGGAIAVIIDPLEVDNQRSRIVLGEGHDLSAKEGHDMI